MKRAKYGKEGPRYRSRQPKFTTRTDNVNNSIIYYSYSLLINKPVYSINKYLFFLFIITFYFKKFKS